MLHHIIEYKCMYAKIQSCIFVVIKELGPIDQIKEYKRGFLIHKQASLYNKPPHYYLFIFGGVLAAVTRIS